MTRAWSALALIFTLFGCLWISVNGKHVCEVKVPKRAESLDEKDWIVREVCCPGYIGFPGYCEPRCKPACVNAKCTAPQECTCNQGYVTVGGTEYSTVGCQPKCNACRYGDCIAPNFCRCWPSFVRRTRGQGCQPIAKLLLPAEQCLKKACNCWQEYFSWTPLLNVVPRCVQICQDDDHSSQSCLKPEKCVCNSLNQYLVCEGDDLPQQYACEAIKRVKTTVDGKDQTDREVQITKVNTQNSTDPNVRREEVQTTTYKLDSADKKDQANSSVDGKEVRIAEVDPTNSTDSTVEGEEVSTTTKLEQANLSASTIGKENDESATEKAQSEPVALQTVKSDDDEELFPTYRTDKIFATHGKTQTEYHMGWTNGEDQSDVMPVLKDVDPIGNGNDNWDIVRYQDNLNQKDHPKRKHKSDRKAVTNIPETTFPKFTNQIYSTHSTAERQYSRTERRYSLGNTQKSEKSSSGVLIWPIVLGCLAVVLVVIAALFFALYLKTKAPVSIRARTM